MQRFWETVIGPVLDAVQPKIIVEIGSDQGGNTAKLLGYCRQTGATLHVIDPAPKYDVSEWQDEHAEHLVFHKDLSLNALPSIEKFDVVLIDGDHNWYTVFNEMQTIERLCKERGREFPLVLLHDIGWPYGRRDLYYDPESIPEEHRKPYAKKGMLPTLPDLVEEGGLNRHLSNALSENGPKNGVLTALEDFLSTSRYELDLIELPGIHGLGILTPTALKTENQDLALLLSKLDFSPFVARYVQGVERARLELQIRQQEEHAEHVRYVQGVKRARRELQARLQEERAQHKRRLAEESHKLREARQELREIRHQSNLAKQELREMRQQSNLAKQELREMRQQSNLAEQEILQLTEWLETLDSGISALLRSRWWKIRSTTVELYRKATFQGERVAVDESLENILRKFRIWRGDGTKRNHGMKDGGVG